MLRQGEKRDLAQLDPAERVAFAQQQTRDFNSFFNPPPASPEISLANRIYAPHAVTLDEVQQMDTVQHNAPPQPTSAGDLK
ncbi:MAG: hypothetical protein INR62_08190 [Rhodospirillales bacterium]|nr:hypothetical protein [Acetobacter sp.]